MKVGWDIIDWRFVVRLRAIRSEYVLIMLLTFLVTVFVDLVTAVALGLIVAGIVRSRDLGRGELDSVLSVPLLDSSDAAHLVDIDPSRLPVGLVRLRGRFSIGSSNELSPRDRRRHRGSRHHHPGLFRYHRCGRQRGAGDRGTCPDRHGRRHRVHRVGPVRRMWRRSCIRSLYCVASPLGTLWTALTRRSDCPSNYSKCAESMGRAPAREDDWRWLAHSWSAHVTTLGGVCERNGQLT